LSAKNAKRTRESSQKCSKNTKRPQTAADLKVGSLRLEAARPENAKWTLREGEIDRKLKKDVFSRERTQRSIENTGLSVFRC
jgi:hypothetical protein